jgi:hypothetical protein
MSERTEKDILNSIEDHLRNINHKTKRIDKNIAFLCWITVISILAAIGSRFI